MIKIRCIKSGKHGFTFEYPDTDSFYIAKERAMESLKELGQNPEQFKYEAL